MVEFLNAEGHISDEWIAQHNAAVEKHRKLMKAHLDSLSDEECESIYHFMTSQWIGSNKMAAWWRESHPDAPWTEEEDVGSGILLYTLVLFRLDKYDPDFRRHPDDIAADTEDGY